MSAFTRGAPIELVPYTSEQRGLQGVEPAGWQQLQPGLYVRTGLGDVILQQGRLIIPAEQLINQLAPLGLEQVGTREANGLTWTLYTLATPQCQTDLAFATDAEGTEYVVALDIQPGARETYYESVFLPVVDNLAPLAD